MALTIATCLHLLLRQTVGIRPTAVTVLYVLALLFSAWQGFGPGYLTLLLGIAVVPYLHSPDFSPTRIDPFLLLMLLAVSSATSWIASARHRVELALRSATEVAKESLRQQLAELENLYAKLPVGLCFLDKELRVVRINERLCGIHRRSHNAHLGRSYTEVLAPDIGATLEGLVRTVLETGMPVVDREIRGHMTEDDPADREWLVSCSRVDTPDNSVVGLQVVIQEITTVKRAERAFLRANEELKQFTYLAAHDLQEPLRTIVNFSQLAQRRATGLLPQDASEHLDRVVAAARRMGGLISDVLAYARAAVDAENDLLSVDLDTVLTATLDSLAQLVGETQATIRRDPLPAVAGDAARLSQVFQNLIVNAIKYRQSETPPAITISAKPLEKMWLIAVTDNGQGFREEYTERIFGMFKRLHGQEVPGSGVGLAICKAIVERHGGRIWAESALGQGSTFFFTLKDSSQAAMPKRSAAPA